MFFRSRFLDLIFLICFENGRFVDPLQNPMGSKMALKSTKRLQNAEKRPMPDAPSFQTLFSRNHRNPWAVGTSWLLKGRFFVGDWLIFCFCYVSLCSVLYNNFITFFKKNIGKRPAVEPSVFCGNRRT